MTAEAAPTGAPDAAEARRLADAVAAARDAITRAAAALLTRGLVAAAEVRFADRAEFQIERRYSRAGGRILGEDRSAHEKAAIEGFEAPTREAFRALLDAAHGARWAGMTVAFSVADGRLRIAVSRLLGRPAFGRFALVEDLHEGFSGLGDIARTRETINLSLKADGPRWRLSAGGVRETHIEATVAATDGMDAVRLFALHEAGVARAFGRAAPLHLRKIDPPGADLAAALAAAGDAARAAGLIARRTPAQTSGQDLRHEP